MRKLFLVAALGVVTAMCERANGQDRICGNEVLQTEVINKDTYVQQKVDEYFANYAEENKAMAEERARANSKNTAEYGKVLIPVVFHIVLSQSQITQLGGTQGVIDRVNSQLAVLNEDFTATNTDLINVPAAFQPLIGKANITFGLAKTDPQGKAKLGIVYKIKDASFTGYSTQDPSVKRDVMGGSSPWDYTKYINVWVTLITASSGQGQGQVLGYAYNADYAQATTGDPALAGVVQHYLTLGRRTGIGQTFYSSSTEKGRTLTHELGHYFNIWHIWGKSSAVTNTSCSDDDDIEDTPLQADGNQNCPIGVQPNCAQKPFAGGEMYMNYMDYSSDVCTKMFSVGQVDRMRIETAPGGKVYSVTQNPHLTLWPTDVAPVEFNNRVDIGPNPTNGYVSIYVAEKYDELKQITITNSIGQLIKDIPVTDQQTVNYSTDISNFAKGVYIVQLHFDQGTISRKIVLQ